MHTKPAANFGQVGENREARKLPVFRRGDIIVERGILIQEADRIEVVQQLCGEAACSKDNHPSEYSCDSLNSKPSE